MAAGGEHMAVQDGTWKKPSSLLHEGIGTLISQGHQGCHQDTEFTRWKDASACSCVVVGLSE